MKKGDEPRIAAIVATLLGTHDAGARTTRVEELLDCVASLRANAYPRLEIIVVDQSPHEQMAAALHPLCAEEPRLRYLHTDHAGKTRAQNLAISQSDADVFVFTDDDCSVPADWIASIMDTLRRHPDAGLLFGAVRPPRDHDWRTAFIPEFQPAQEERLLPSFLPRANRLLGANMVVRRTTFARVGLFNEMFGPGGTVAEANEEGEFTLRVRRATPPIPVYITPAFYVVHEHGARAAGAPARHLLRTYQRAQSAVLAAHAAHGDLGAACRLALIAGELTGQGLSNVVRTGRPRGIGMIVPYLQGIAHGVRARQAVQPARESTVLRHP